MDTIMLMDDDSIAHIRLLGWLSPSFPVGAFAYSHGLEAAVEAELVSDRGSLANWLDGLVRFGSARNDALLLVVAHRSVSANDPAMVTECADLASMMFGAPELELEALGQGAAFWRTVTTSWPHQGFARWAECLPEKGAAYPVAVGIAAAVHGIPLAAVAPAFLHAFVANGISAAIRLGVIGQTDGQHVQYDLEAMVAATARDLADATLDDIGSAAVTLDVMALSHETQTTRLFRS
jgi:urease accessory protein